MYFGELENLNDTDLLNLLKEVPNETLLMALSNNASVGVTQRICEVLSFEGTKYFLDDLKNVNEVPEKSRSESQEYIISLAIRMMEDGVIGTPQVQRPRLLAS